MEVTRFITTAEAAKLARVSQRTIERWVQNGVHGHILKTRKRDLRSIEIDAIDFFTVLEELSK